MKKFLIIMMLFAVPFVAEADQRFETWQGLCHFAYDPNDDDNEVYFANCDNSIVTHQGVAHGHTRTIQKGGSPIGQSYEAKRLIGAATNADYYPGYTVSNTACVMVTSNYDAGADDNNETVYTTNDWDLTIAKWEQVFQDIEIQDLVATVTSGGYDAAMDFNNDGEVNYLDINIHRRHATNNVRYELHCRNGQQ